MQIKRDLVTSMIKRMDSCNRNHYLAQGFRIDCKQDSHESLRPDMRKPKDLHQMTVACFATPIGGIAKKLRGYEGGSTYYSFIRRGFPRFFFQPLYKGRIALCFRGVGNGHPRALFAVFHPTGHVKGLQPSPGLPVPFDGRTLLLILQDQHAVLLGVVHLLRSYR